MSPASCHVAQGSCHSEHASPLEQEENMIANWAYDLLIAAAITGAIAYCYRIGYAAGWTHGHSTARRNHERKAAERV